MQRDEPDEPFPQAGRRRLILPPPIARSGLGLPSPEAELLGELDGETVMLMGDHDGLPRMPKRPRLLDFFRLRFEEIPVRHLLVSAQRARDAGLDDTTVMACLLHDISNACLIRSDHGYWGAQMIAPYVSEEVAWAVRYHQALRYVADEEAGYAYPEAYRRFFGPDYVPPAYILRDAAEARRHRWYMTARYVTIFDTYFFEESDTPDPESFADLIGRMFREPEEGLGLDDSPAAHMWRTVIWPNNFI